MKWIVLLIYLVSGVVAFCAAQEKVNFNLMPMPARIASVSGQFRLNDGFRIIVTGNPELRMFRSATRTLRQLSNRTGLFFNQDYIGPDSDVLSAAMRIQVVRPGRLQLGEDESYELNILPGRIELTAPTDLGAIRGLATLLQLLDADPEGYFFPCVSVQDRPRFPWRGLLIDVCRHFMPVDVIKRNLDAMAAVKLNVLHLHLTEDQGFRIECKTYPKLHELGSDGFYFTQAQIRDIIRYADERGIRVVPEFDMPGHSTSWFVGYPDLASAPGPYTISRTWGIQKPVMNPVSERIYAFLDGFLGEMCSLFPDAYMHIGGDEAQFEQWEKNRVIRQFMRDQSIRDYHELQAVFIRRIFEKLSYYGKNMMGWDEILHPDLSDSILIQSWRGREAMLECARKGICTILSNGYYIDLIQPAEDHYLNDPAPSDMPLNMEQRKYILGGEATMWTEYVTQETVDSRIWPRTAAIAERLWSPESVNDVRNMYSRLKIISLQLETYGLMHEKNVDMMLRRLAGTPEIACLRHLTDVLEPVKYYQRSAQRDYTSYSPLTRLVDAARPDAEVAREFRWAVDRFCANPEDATAMQTIRDMLGFWIQNHAGLDRLIQQSPALKEARPLAINLYGCAKTGIEALNKIANHEAVSKKWKKQQLKILESMDKPHAQAELMIVPAIEKLVSAIGET
ncbi:family 20 glycosylhydrolase [bacterium]|nr:family 20 glycosylhydrolase [bacterium]